MRFHRDRSLSSGGFHSGWSKFSAVVLLLALCALGSVMVQAQATAEATPPPCPAPDTHVSSQITEYTIPTADSEPYGIAAGTDGALWFGEGAGSNIGKVTTEGKFTEFPFPVTHSDQHFLAAGPDGAMWFTDDWQNKIGRITSDGSITEYPIPSGTSDTDDNNVAYTTSLPRALIVGSDGALWFSEHGTHKLGRMTADGTITEYTVPTANGDPLGLALGSDGAVWFTETAANQIGRITTDGTITEYPVPTEKSFPLRIAAGADGALWFAEYSGNKIGRITTGGTITEYALPACAGPVGVTLGPDQAIWFTELSDSKIGRIAVDGQITEYVIPTADSQPFSIITGSDGALWFTENASSKIGRLQIQAAALAPSPTPAPRSAGKIIATIPVGTGEGPLSQAIGEGAIWIHNNAGGVLRINPATNQVVATIHVGGGPYSYMAIGEGALWVGMYDNDMVARIDPQTNKVVATIPVGHAPEGIGVTPGAVWVANHHDGSVSRIDPATNTVVSTITDVGHKGIDGPLVLITGAGSVWVEVPNINAVVRIDPATNAVVKTFTGYTGGLAVDSESFWYGTSAGLSRVDPTTNQITATVPVSLQQNLTQVAIGFDSIWVKSDKVLLQIDPQTNQIIGQLQIPGGGDMAIGEGSIWASVEDSGSLLRIEPAPIVAQTPEATPETTAVVVDSTPSGSPLTLVWQTGGTPDEIMISPNHLAVDAQGNIYVGTEAVKGSVRVFDANGKFVTALSAADHIDGGERGGASIGFDPEGNVYVSDFYTGQVEKFDNMGTLLTQWATEAPLGPSTLVVDAQGDVYIGNHRLHDHYIQKFDRNGQLLTEWGSTGSGDGQIGSGGTDGIALDQQGNVYVADYDQNRVEKFDSDGSFIASFGTQGFSGKVGQFNKPHSVAVDGQGNIYVVDLGFIQKLDPNGNFLARWSTDTPDLRNTWGMTVDAQGNIFVCADGEVTIQNSTTGRTTKITIPVLKKFSQS